jgi:uncharacterized membrane protein required for colicin V production
LGSQFAWFFDAVTGALILIFIYVGGKRGFVRSFLMIAGYFLSLVAAYYVSRAAAPVIYDKLLSERIVSAIEEKIENINVADEVKKALNLESMGVTLEDEEVKSVVENSSGNLGEEIRQYILQKTGVDISQNEIMENLKKVFNENIYGAYIKALPGYMTKTSSAEYSDSGLISSAMKAFASGKTDAARYIEQTVVKGSIIAVLEPVLFILVFTIAMIAVKIVTRLFSVVNKVPFIGTVNSIFGALLGAAEALLVIYIIAVIINIVIYLSGSEMIVFNDETIQNTYLFKYIYNFKLIK